MMTNGTRNEFKGAPEEALAATAPIADAHLGVAEVTVINHRDAKISNIYSWQNERIVLLQQILAGVERKAANGSSVARALRQAALRWAGKFYKTAPRKPLAFSYNTLARCFYAWRKGGRTAAALQLNYKPAQEKLPREIGALLARLSLEGDALSFSQAIRAIGEAGLIDGAAPSVSTFLRKVPEPVRRELRGVFRKRVDLRRAERRARAVCVAKGSAK